MLLGAVWLLISIKEYLKNIFTQENLLWIIKTTSGPDLPAENLNYTCTKAEPGTLGQFDGWTHEFWFTGYKWTAERRDRSGALLGWLGRRRLRLGQWCCTCLVEGACRRCCRSFPELTVLIRNILFLSPYSVEWLATISQSQHHQWRSGDSPHHHDKPVLTLGTLWKVKLLLSWCVHAQGSGLRKGCQTLRAPFHTIPHSI